MPSHTSGAGARRAPRRPPARRRRRPPRPGRRRSSGPGEKPRKRKPDPDPGPERRRARPRRSRRRVGVAGREQRHGRGAHGGGDLDHDRHRPGGGPPADQAADEVGEAVGERRRAARARPPSGRQDAPASEAAAASRPAASSMRIDSPTAFSAAWVAGQAARRPSRCELGEVDAEPRSRAAARRPGRRRSRRRRAGRRPPGCGSGHPGLQVPARDGVLHQRRRRRAGTRDDRGTPSAVPVPTHGRPDDHARRRSAALPGRTGTHDPDEADDDGQAGEQRRDGHGSTGSHRAPERRRGPGDRRGLVAGSGAGQCSPSGAPAGSSRSLLGLVVDVDRDRAELLAVLAGVVGAEQELAAAGEVDAEVGLGAAAVAAVTGCQGAGCNGSGHGGLPSCRPRSTSAGSGWFPRSVPPSTQQSKHGGCFPDVRSSPDEIR